MLGWVTRDDADEQSSDVRRTRSPPGRLCGAALANEERLLIALWLAESECTVRELEEVTGMRQSLVSYHLQELRREGIVAASPAGRSNRYRLSRVDLDQLAKLIGGLTSSGSGG